MLKSGWRGERAFCVCYVDPELETPNSRYTEKVLERLGGVATGTAPAMINHNDHDLDISFGDKLLDALRDADIDLDSEGTRIVLDITVGSSRLLLEGTANAHSRRTGIAR